MACLPGIRLALADYGPDDTPDVTPRPLSQLVEWADDASRFCDETRFSLAGRDVAALITESQAYAATATGADRTRAYGALVTACMVAGAIAKNLGNIDLSSTAARRGYAFARRADDHGLIGFDQWYWALGLMRCQGTMRLAARRRTLSVLTAGVDELTPAVTLRHTDTTLPAEMVGLVRLTSAHTESRERRSDEAHSTPGRGSRPRTGRRRDTPQCRALVLALAHAWAQMADRTTPRRFGTWTPPTVPRLSAFVPTRWPVIWSPRSTAVPGAACGSLTACVTGSASTSGPLRAANNSSHLARDGARHVDGPSAAGAAARAAAAAAGARARPALPSARTGASPQAVGEPMTTYSATS